MCYGCWETYGKPVLDSAQIQVVVAQIGEVYEHSLSGGWLHIVVDDWNLEDGHLDTCAVCIDENAATTDPARIAAERACLAGLRVLTEDERASALARYEGFIEERT